MCQDDENGQDLRRVLQTQKTRRFFGGTGRTFSFSINLDIGQLRIVITALHNMGNGAKVRALENCGPHFSILLWSYLGSNKKSK